jgi:hypothetical protein
MSALGGRAAEVVTVIAMFGLVVVLGFAAARWRPRKATPHPGAWDLEEWGLGGRAFGGTVTFFLVGGDLYTAYTVVAVPALVYAEGASGFFAVSYVAITYPLVYVALPRLWPSGGSPSSSTDRRPTGPSTRGEAWGRHRRRRRRRGDLPFDGPPGPAPGASVSAAADPPGCAPAWPWSCARAGCGSEVSARASCSACGLETSLARIAASSVTFIPAICVLPVQSRTQPRLL